MTSIGSSYKICLAFTEAYISRKKSSRAKSIPSHEGTSHRTPSSVNPPISLSTLRPEASSYHALDLRSSCITAMHSHHIEGNGFLNQKSTLQQNMKIHTRMSSLASAIQMDKIKLKSKKQQYANALHCNTTIMLQEQSQEHAHSGSPRSLQTTCLIYNIISPIAEHPGSQEGKQLVRRRCEELRSPEVYFFVFICLSCLPAYGRA